MRQVAVMGDLAVFMTLSQAMFMGITAVPMSWVVVAVVIVDHNQGATAVGQ